MVATTKADTFEKELNALASKGWRFIPASLASVEKRVLMMSAYNYETVGVVEKVVGPTPVSYRVISTVRVETFERELQALAAQDFRLIGFAIGLKEQVSVLHTQNQH